MPALPLEGVRVLDCTQVMAGPFCTLLLADMGADVVKVERPDGGDDTRRLAPFVNGVSAAFLIVNRNKRSLALDLKRQEGQEVFRRLARDADILVENFRPGTMERFGLAYPQLRELNPSLIYCSVSGFGQTGPYRDRGGFDLVAQGMSGIMSVTGIPGGPPVKAGVPITDLAAGMLAANGVLVAYIHRLRTGQGQLVDTSLLEAGIALTFWESAIYFATGHAPEPMGSAHRLSAPYQALRCQDKHITLGAANQANWERLCRAIGRPELQADPRFPDPSTRLKHYRELAALLEETLKTKPAAHWLGVLEKAGVPAGPIYDMAEVYADPHVLARGMLAEVEHPHAGRVKNIGIPVKLSETPGSIRCPAPLLGQHTEEVLRQAGFTEGEIARLRECEVVR
ncbi:MAG: CoA transferase [Chloroflexi bacterium]|nr:CoA transferase [Chloroflexota bacterium]